MYIVHYIISVQENSACLNSTDTPFSLQAVPKVRLSIKGQPTGHCNVYIEGLSYLTQMLHRQASTSTLTDFNSLAYFTSGKT